MSKELWYSTVLELSDELWYKETLLIPNSMSAYGPEQVST